MVIIDKTIKQIKFKNASFSDMSRMTLDEQSKYYNSRIRRTIRRNYSIKNKVMIKNILNKDQPRIRAKNLIITPQFVNKNLLVYNGQKHIKLTIKPEMCGHYVGEFIPTRKLVKHSKLGKGATKSSKYTPIK